MKTVNSVGVIRHLLDGKKLARPPRCPGKSRPGALRTHTRTRASRRAPLTMFCMSAMTSAMPTVGVRRTVSAPRAAQPQALSAFPAMNGMSSVSLGLRSEGACRVDDEPSRPRRPNLARRDEHRARDDAELASAFETILGARRRSRRASRPVHRRAASAFRVLGFWSLDNATRAGGRTRVARRGHPRRRRAPPSPRRIPRARSPHPLPLRPPEPDADPPPPPPFISSIRCLRGVFRRGEWG